MRNSAPCCTSTSMMPRHIYGYPCCRWRPYFLLGGPYTCVCMGTQSRCKEVWCRCGEPDRLPFTTVRLSSGASCVASGGAEHTLRDEQLHALALPCLHGVE